MKRSFLCASYLLFLLNVLLNILPVYSREQEEQEKRALLQRYSREYCDNNYGRALFPIQNKIYVDCLTTTTLWKLGFARDWPKVLTEAMFLPIYDNYKGVQEYKPGAGIVLVRQSPSDYKYLVKLRQLVKYYNLPVQIDSIEKYGTRKRSLFSKRFKIF